MRQARLISKNSFTGGMRQDEMPSLANDTTYQLALNAINSSSQHSNFGLVNEGSTKTCNTTGNIVGKHYIEERNQHLLLKEGDEFWLLDDATHKEHLVFKASEFGCNFDLGGCEWHDIESTVLKSCNEIYIYFSSKCEYYMFNLDEMLDLSRKAGLKQQVECGSGCATGCDLFKVMQCACSPKTNARGYKTGGGNLQAGAYQFTGRFINADGGFTNWFSLSDPAYVGSEHNIAGEPGNGHIELQFSCLDCRFNKIEIAVLERKGGNISARTLGVKNYTDTKLSINYYGNEGTPIDFQEILLKGETYIQGKSLLQRDGRMYYYRLKERHNLNYQAKALAIDTSYVVYETPYEYAKKHNMKSLMRGETYAFGIVWNFKDGTHTHAFHIPGTPSAAPATSNDSADYQGSGDNKPGVGGATTKRNKSNSSSSSVETICEYSTVDSINQELLYNVTSTELQLFVARDLKTNLDSDDFINCSRDVLKKKGTAIICLEDADGNIVEFSATSTLSYDDGYIRFRGNLTEGNTSTTTEVVFEGAIKCYTSSGGSTGGGASAGMGSGGGGNSQASTPTVTIDDEQCVIRKRSEKEEDDVTNPQTDDFDDFIKAQLDRHDTVAADLTQEIRLQEDSLQAQCCGCKESTEIFSPEVFRCAAGDDNDPETEADECQAITAAAPFVCCPTGSECAPGTAVTQSQADHADVDQGAAGWLGMLASYLDDNLDATADINATTTIKDAAKLVMDRIQNRERIVERKRVKYNVSKSVSYSGGSSILKNNTEETSIGSGIVDCCGAPETELELTIVSTGKPEPKEETNLLYPCSTDCDGNLLYGGLAGSPVTHHKFPDASQEPHYVSMSVGVPSELTPEADEYSDGYVRLMGPRFSNIEFPSEEDLPIPLCDSNPYTIVMVKRTDKNKTVLLKGLATGTFGIRNNGKDYHQPKHAVNSRTYVSRYNDNGGCRLSDGGSENTFNIFSLDGLVRKPALNADLIRNEGEVNGIGYRHRLYSRGEEPTDANKEREDNLGTIQSVNLNQFTPQGGESALGFKIYAPANSVVSPPVGGSVPLNNKYQQESIWVGASLPTHEDDSFLGDVLNHAAPIESATGNYVALVRDLDDQYGSLENLSYIPILWAGKREIYNGSIEGPAGDVYISPYSFVKTGYVSDKVGTCKPGTPGCTAADTQKFNIPSMVPGVKQERRCVCDGPDDVIKQYAGLWLWTDLPEDGDPADPKNWAGTHTDGSKTYTHTEAVGNAAISDMYFPKVVKTLITYWGEFEVNPWMREKSDALDNQWYPEIMNEYRLHNGSSVDGVGEWKDTYLAQFRCAWKQPSQRKRLLKAAIRGLITIVFPIYGVSTVFDVNSGLDALGKLAEYPFMVIMWYLLNQVLYKNDAIDKLLGIPVCKSDDVGSDADACVKGFFENYDRYNWDYSAQNDAYIYSGMPDTYHTCKCDNCLGGEYSNSIYYSDKQYTNSSYNAYKHIRPNNYVNIPANAGKLTNLFSKGGSFYAHTTDAIWQLVYGRTAIASDTGSIILGTGDLLGEPQTPAQGIVEGFAGLQYHNAAINTQFGYFFVDAEARKVYKFDQGLEEISSAGMFHFFKNRLAFCECTDCVDQKVEGTSFYSLGVDPRHNRFLITKNEPNPKSSFTLSYDLDEKKWLSFHSYIPRDYMWTRAELYSIKDSVWEHNQSCDFQNFYGEYYPHIIEFSAVGKQGQQPLKAFEYQESTLRTESDICHTEDCAYIQDIDHTFNKINLRNSTQTTGTLDVILVGDDKDVFESARDLILERPKSVKLHKQHREYNFNDIHDHRWVDCADRPLTTCQECEPFSEIIEYECSPENKQNYQGKVIEDDHLIYRLILDDGKSNRQLKTLFMETYTSSTQDNQQP